MSEDHVCFAPDRRRRMRRKRRSPRRCRRAPNDEGSVVRGLRLAMTGACSSRSQRSDPSQTAVKNHDEKKKKKKKGSESRHGDRGSRGSGCAPNVGYQSGAPSGSHQSDVPNRSRQTAEQSGALSRSGESDGPPDACRGLVQHRRGDRTNDRNNSMCNNSMCPSGQKYEDLHDHRDGRHHRAQSTHHVHEEAHRRSVLLLWAAYQAHLVRRAGNIRIASSADGRGLRTHAVSCSVLHEVCEHSVHTYSIRW
mmetsp:Transcript_18999/g.56964  ORF Transcript_18999/g.56964 Transcript_18999/m.56964 type:complete len:251 (+) Transcript_18999:638-1390(+)